MRYGTGNAGQASQAAASLLLKSFGRMTLLESCHNRIQHHTAVLNASHAMLIDPHVLSLFVHGNLSTREVTNSCSVAVAVVQ
jgi:hypothetical protein